MKTCAVLIPSRARPDRLHKTMQSIFASVKDVNNIEVILRFDDDDSDTILRLEEFQQYPETTVMIGPRKTGWASLNLFYEEMAAVAKSKWIWIMNDDAVFEGNDWDEKLAQVPTEGYLVQPEIYQLGRSRYQNAHGGAFPCMPNLCWKKWIEIIPDPIDTKIDEILRVENGWQSHFLSGIGVVHDRDNDEELAMHRQL